MTRDRQDHALYRYRFGDAEFDEAKFELRVSGLAVDVQRKPLEMLALLLQRAGEVITKDEFLARVWKGRPTVENVVGNAMAKLRAALGEKSAAFVLTQPRIGYRFDGRLERMVVGRAPSSDFELGIGTPVPGREHFHLEAVLDRSDGSEVWLARHAKTKEPRVFKFARDGMRLAALRREATLYRVLRGSLGERDDFATIIDWNFEAPPYYLEIEYGGENLAEWARRDCRLAAMPLASRLDLLGRIVAAVAAAHSVGVLHKDLKPSNILIQPSADGWRLCVADFGSGDLVEEERLHQLGITYLDSAQSGSVRAPAMTGTPLYIAPEVIAGHEPTVRSDVFSLGVIMYQMVVGDFQSPMATGWERNIDDELLREDIACAADGDPQRRFASAFELHERLTSIESRRQKRREQREQEAARLLSLEAMQRAKARRPWIIAAFALLIVGLATSSLLYLRSEQERTRAERESARANAINHFLNEDLLATANPNAPGEIYDPHIRELLARAAERVSFRFTSDPETAASIHTTLGRTYAELSDYENAEAHLRRAIALLASARTPSDTLFAAEYDLVPVLLMESKRKDALALLDDADSGLGDRLARPTALAATARFTRSDYFYDSNQLDQALPLIEQAEKLREASGSSDDDLEFKIRGKLADCYIARNRWRDAHAQLAILTKPEFDIARIGVKNWGRVRLALGEVLSGESKYPDAERVDLEALREMGKRLGEEHFYTAFALSELAGVYTSEGKWDAAFKLAERTYRITLKTLGPNSQDALLSLGNLGILEVDTGHFSSAIPKLEKAISALASLLDAENPAVMELEFYLADALNETGEAARAWDLAAKLDPGIMANGVEGEIAWDPRIRGLKGQILLRLKRKREGLDMLETAVQDMERAGVKAWVALPYKQALAAAR